MTRMIIAAALTAAGFAVTEAAAQVYFNAPVKFAGTGCGAGSYAVSGAGTDTLSILFSAYDAASPAENAASGLDRASCSFAVPISVPAGCQISVLTADWRGFAEGDTELFREYFFAGQNGISKITNPVGNYTERDSRMRHETVSVSGEEMKLRINSSVRALADDSYIVVDSADMHNTLVLHVEQQSCGTRALPAVFKLLL
uniref:DUF4360 domain-containing protein n=1 Tax=Candidatus Electronema sp. TaxID=2698783 RepID=UPI0040569A73